MHGKLVDTAMAGNGYHGRCDICGLALVTDLGYCSWDNSECIPKKVEPKKVEPKKKHVKTIKDIERPTYNSDNRALCSIDQINKAREGVKKEMIKFIKKNEKYGLTPGFIDGLTSVSSQAYSELRNDNTIIIVDGNVKLNKNA